MKKIAFDSSISFESPIGVISVCAQGGTLTKVTIGEDLAFGKPAKVLNRAKRHILKLLSGSPSQEELDFQLSGTDFQIAVWHEIAKVPFGESISYGQLAAAAGNPKAVRAAGAAVGANPLPLIIGCHRVLGANSKITGYSAGEGLPTKRKLLAIEKISYRE